MRSIDIAGNRYGKLTAKTRLKNRSRTTWLCVCDCGNDTEVYLGHLRNGHTRSCGCLLGKRKEYHGKSNAPEYRVWVSMIRRCTDTSNKHYSNYGGRGISVCAKWVKSFEAFYLYIGERPSKEYFIDRIDSNGNYEEGNVRWVTRKVNQQNTRRSRVWVVEGRTYNSCQDASDFEGVSKSTIRRWCIGGTNNGKPIEKREDCYSYKKYEE